MTGRRTGRTRRNPVLITPFQGGEHPVSLAGESDWVGNVRIGWLFGLLLMAHGLIHVAIWLTPASSDAPFDVRHAPLLGDLGAIATAGGLLAGAGFVVSGIAYMLDATWWPVALGAAAGVSIVLLLATFTAWWLLAIAIDVALGAVALQAVGGSR